MNTPVMIRTEFNYRARDIAREEAFLHRPSLLIEDKIFHDILAPVRKVFENGRFYAGKKPLGISGLIKELRSMCLEAQLAHTTTDSCTRKRRTQLLNALQNIAECAESGGA